jgi:hypothetical protein
LAMQRSTPPHPANAVVVVVAVAAVVVITVPAPAAGADAGEVMATRGSEAVLWVVGVARVWPDPRTAVTTIAHLTNSSIITPS